ncbi:MAG: glycoside hydrolase family 16 protein [Acholeplasmataceae bacterium]|nr:glycoside hydrolase family 16 protein [Acholeplasmataceae bacterium]
MKKILIIALLMFILVGCEKDSGEVPNGLLPLTAIDDCDEPTLEGGWTCIWADEFNGTEVDETKWNFEVNGSGGGNNELQYYTRENASIVDGKLVITAKKESYLGKDYTSSRLTTKYKGTFEYVRIVVRAKNPVGRGTWSAIWMMPLMNAYGGWPDSGEIDIMEYVGYDPSYVHSTIHTEKFNHNLNTQIGFGRLVPNSNTEFHDYELIWSPGYLKTMVDGETIGEFNYVPALTSDTPYPEAFPFDQEFFLILNLAIGGNWGGVQGVDTTAFPTTFEIDYARVYKQDYATLDKEKPSEPENISLAQLKNTIYWQKSTDDYGVAEYAVYLDGEFHKYANLNQITFSGLNIGQTYQVQIQAVDFVGRASSLSESFSLMYT